MLVKRIARLEELAGLNLKDKFFILELKPNGKYRIVNLPCKSDQEVELETLRKENPAAVFLIDDIL